MTGLLVLTFFAFWIWNGGLTLLIVLLTSITIYYLDFNSRFWNPYCEAMDTFTSGTSTTTGFVRHLTLLRGLWSIWGLEASKVLWSFRFGVQLHFGLYLQRTVLIWLILLKFGWTYFPWRRLFAWITTALVFLEERTLILGFWLFVWISDLHGFLLLVFALAIKVSALSVHLLSLVSVLFIVSHLYG